MGTPFLGELRIVSFNFPPKGWALANGQFLPINQNQALFSLLGTMYGGDGQETFNLPNLQSRVPMHAGTGPIGTTYQLGEAAGVESVTLTTQQIPTHNHAMLASTNSGTGTSPSNAVLASGSNVSIFRPATIPNQPMNAQAVSPVGGSQPHENTQPYLVISFIISLFGRFPSPT